MLHFQAFDDTSRTILKGPLGGIFFPAQSCSCYALLLTLFGKVKVFSLGLFWMSICTCHRSHIFLICPLKFPGPWAISTNQGQSSFCLHKPALLTLYQPTLLVRRLVLLQKQAIRMIIPVNLVMTLIPAQYCRSFVLYRHMTWILAEIGKIMVQHNVGLLPNIFFRDFPLLHGYNTRNASSLHVPKCRTNIRLFRSSTRVLCFLILSAQTFKIQLVLQLLKTS